jgi:hypothetical protein
MTHGKQLELHRGIDIFLVEVTQSAIDTVHRSAAVEAEDGELEGWFG